MLKQNTIFLQACFI